MPQYRGDQTPWNANPQTQIIFPGMLDIDLPRVNSQTDPRPFLRNTFYKDKKILIIFMNIMNIPKVKILSTFLVMT